MADAVINQQSTKYPIEVMKVVRASLGADESSTEMDSQINALAQVRVMDIYLESLGNPARGQVIRDAVGKVFGFDLDLMSQNDEGNLLASYNSEIMAGVRTYLGLASDDESRDSAIMSLKKNDVMDHFLSAYGESIQGSDSRRIINYIFGVNIDGLSGLERSRLSVYSKGQWELNNRNDVLIIKSSKGDVDLYVGPTAYYVDKLGSNQLPAELEKALLSFGFTLDTAANLYTYHNVSGESVPDAFKGQVIGAIVACIQASFADL
ncbi:MULTISPECIES: hypothetical protein [unclassified Paenibacillus]|uniref:hypothetical protein n=1 Tax=unclassified Paenibacillus TaxID=185978 RepID=UPI000953AC7F|nr:MULTISPECIES: hypothetical protein [unclassified Paenibacillus]ASS67523.1 hypothetical protein CIC07_16265 [Paenibacillus sp. RUD330]SIQ73975.1 hypothetical protein SAMN05880555_2175 [Paenibacillus sp. RU4X]SIQ95424.1 hypothetical protein SAMN05880570_2174 [Paenibacillus sp. RU4T]